MHVPKIWSTKLVDQTTLISINSNSKKYYVPLRVPFDAKQTTLSLKFLTIIYSSAFIIPLTINTEMRVTFHYITAIPSRDQSKNYSSAWYFSLSTSVMFRKDHKLETCTR